jgi:hypothetical protein
MGMLGSVSGSAVSAVLRSGSLAAVANVRAVPSEPPGIAGRTDAQQSALEVATDEASGFAQLAAMAAIGLNVLLPAIELGRMVLFPTGTGLTAIPQAGLLATLCSCNCTCTTSMQRCAASGPLALG